MVTELDGYAWSQTINCISAKPS